MAPAGDYDDPRQFTFIITFLLSSLLTDTKPDRDILKIEQEWKAGKYKDPIEVMILIEKSKTTKVSFGNNSIQQLGILVSIIIVLVIILFIVKKLYPFYNFYWGDYIKEYDKKKSIRKYILVIIVTGIIVSAVGGILVNKISLFK